jgi:hypothetical protein
MRVRTLQVVLLFAVLFTALAPAATAMARPRHAIVLAQDEGTDNEQSGGQDKGGKGQKNPEAETDPGAGEEAEEEEGPPWTYQMARLSIGLILLLGGGIALIYRRLIGARQRANT